MKTYRALAALLSYPDPELIEALPQIRPFVPPAAEPLVAELSCAELLALQERYVELFDRSRALSLNLFEHVHGESRDRGQAMVDLLALYKQRGMRVAQGELPDYLPAFLEYLSLLRADEAEALLGETAEILRALGERLRARGSAYAGVFSALLGIAGAPGFSRNQSAPEKEDVERSWSEPEVSFGGPQPVRLYRNGVPV